MGIKKQQQKVELSEYEKHNLWGFIPGCLLILDEKGFACFTLYIITTIYILSIARQSHANHLILSDLNFFAVL